ncbi:hypothetical protein [Tateyamaria sp.]|uniref:hypothetical protein n=1 Tax=Tateyamaria sp. TaxID=1929288 RepID=UPI0032A0428A
MRKSQVLIILGAMNILAVASIWIGYFNHRQSLGMAEIKHFSDIALQLALPTFLVIGFVSVIGLLMLYVGTFCIWKLKAANRMSRVILALSLTAVLGAIGLAYASIFHSVEIGVLALISFLILFGAAIALFRYLPQMMAHERSAFQFLRS